MQTPSTLTIWLSEQAGLLAGVFGVLLIFYCTVAYSARRRLLRLRADRSSKNEDTFVETLRLYGFDPDITSTAYRYLQDNQHVQFPIEPFDRLDEDLGLGLPELDQTIMDVLYLTQRAYHPGLTDGPIVTVEDMLRFVQACPRLRDPRRRTSPSKVRDSRQGGRAA